MAPKGRGEGSEEAAIGAQRGRSLSFFPFLTNVMPPFTRKLTEVIVASHPILNGLRDRLSPFGNRRLPSLRSRTRPTPLCSVDPGQPDRWPGSSFSTPLPDRQALALLLAEPKRLHDEDFGRLLIWCLDGTELLGA